ncbi:MAG: hypothetical protein AB2989_01390 [Candidatus Symbiodolus clandestinus]
MKLLQDVVQKYLTQKLAGKNPYDTGKIIYQCLEKIKALQDSLQKTELEANNVNEALTWLCNAVEALTQAKKRSR